MSDVVGNRDIVEDGISGFLRPFGATSAMAEVVVELLEDSALAARIVARGRDRLRDRFNVTIMGNRLEELYRELSTRPERLEAASALSTAT
jgi:glycosyltransferase involved in cell wall biosynthesis